MRVLLPLTSIILLAGCMTASVSAQPSAAAAERHAKDEVKLAKALEGKIAGEPVSCINLRNVRSTKSYGDATMLYVVSSRLVYRNDPPGGCPMRDDRTIITRTPTNMLCRGDIAQIKDLTSGFGFGGCSLGEFVPYRPG